MWHIVNVIFDKDEFVVGSIKALLGAVSTMWTGANLHVSSMVRCKKGADGNHISLLIDVPVRVPGHGFSVAVKPHIVVNTLFGSPANGTGTFGVEAVVAVFLVGKTALASPAQSMHMCIVVSGEWLEHVAMSIGRSNQSGKAESSGSRKKKLHGESDEILLV